MVYILIMGRIKIATFGLANRVYMIRAKQNVPMLRGQTTDKILAGHELNV